MHRVVLSYIYPRYLKGTHHPLAKTMEAEKPGNLTGIYGPLTWNARHQERGPSGGMSICEAGESPLSDDLRCEMHAQGPWIVLMNDESCLTFVTVHSLERTVNGPTRQRKLLWRCILDLCRLFWRFCSC